jgi:hypothetical protein
MGTEFEEVKSDVEEMNKAFGHSHEEPADETPVEEPVEEPQEELTEPDEPDEPDEESTDTTEAPTTEAPVEDEKDKLIAELRAKVDQLSVKEEPPVEEPTDQQQTPLTFDEQDFIGELDLDDLTRDPKEFNKLLNTIYQKAVTDTRQILGEHVLRSVPEIVRANITIMNNLQKASEEFYAANEDLKPFKKVVATVFEEIASENPGKPFEEIFPMVADESRKRLELHKKVTQPTNKPPRLPNRKNRVTVPATKPTTDPLLAELEEMNKTLRR